MKAKAMEHVHKFQYCTVKQSECFSFKDGALRGGMGLNTLLRVLVYCAVTRPEGHSLLS